jgi:hypothetical protein
LIERENGARKKDVGVTKGWSQRQNEGLIEGK